MLRLGFLLLLLGGDAANRQRKYGKDRPDPEEVTNYVSSKVKLYGEYLDDCTMAKQDGIYTTFFRGQNKNSTVRCVASFFGGGWTVIQRRRENLVDFRRNWADYQNGFGDIKTEFWYGLEKIYRITMSEPTEILFLMQNTEGTRAYAMYDRFALFGLNKSYTIRTLGEYTGEAGNGMQYHLNMPFSTYDRKNTGPRQGNCSTLFWGGWWYNNCYTSNLNGKYPAKEEMHTKCYRCIAWTYFQQYRPITFVQIMTRPTRTKT